MQKITPCLWYASQAEEAAKFYVSIFKTKSRIRTITRYGPAAAKASGQPAGSVMTVQFVLNGQEFLALNGGPIFKLSPAVSFIVHCKTQKEIDNYWKKLSAGGQPSQCGWLTDKFGLSWQIVPADLDKLLASKKPGAPERVMQAIMGMVKLDLNALKKAAAGK
ncbi:MAG TPA: VOC family protein [Planctomycetota bacterium]|nr:VOC family protein [Planctomycetota bacterium]